MQLYAPEKFLLALLGRQGVLWLLRAGFVAVLLATFFGAVLPDSLVHRFELIPWDKAQHFMAFFMLTVLATLAFPAFHVLPMAVALSGFGALIEVVQGLEFVGRDRDFLDWVADTLAVGAVMVPMLVARWRLVYLRTTPAPK